MDKKILQSIIQLTRQRDVDSLEVSLVATFAELLDIDNIALYKLINERKTDALEEIVNLSIVQNGEQPTYLWRNERKIIKADKALNNCIRTEEMKRHNLGEDHSRILFPVFQDDHMAGVIDMTYKGDLSFQEKLLESYTTIYGNYLTVLSESEHDKLTGLLNRSTFNKKLERLVKSQREFQLNNRLHLNEKRNIDPSHSAWLAMIDIDLFKPINDKFGHLFGDEVILVLSQKMKRFFRNTDLLFRFGGEEFIVVLEPIPEDMAKQTFERFRIAIAEHPFPQIGTVTISIGYSRLSKKTHHNITIEHADMALYYSKQNGRNMVHCYEELLAEGKLPRHKKAGNTLFFD